MESLVTLSIIVTILLVLYPLIVEWLITRQTEKEQVEQSRVLYEQSNNWVNTNTSTKKETYTIQSTNNSLKIIHDNQSIGVDIYEVEFKE